MRKKVTFHADEAWILHLKSLGANVSAYIVQAVEEKAARDGSPFVVAAIAPHGVRNDALPVGWKSRLYKDRYQLVAEYTPDGFVICHYHEYRKPILEAFGILEVPHPPTEITVVGVPEGMSRESVAHDIRWAVMEMGLE